MFCMSGIAFVVKYGGKLVKLEEQEKRVKASVARHLYEDGCLCVEAFAPECWKN